MNTTLPHSRINYLALWRQVPFLAELDDATLSALSAAAHAWHYAAGEYLFDEGEPAGGLYIVEKGQVKICRFSKEGREYILHIIEPGGTFNDVAALDGGPNPATAIALTDATVWRVGHTELKQIAIQHPSFAWAMLESMARRTRHLVASVQDLAMRSVRGRLARLLLAQAEMAEQGHLTPTLTQEEMASRLGTVREMVGRALRALAGDGIIEFDRHRIVVLDEEKLRKEAEV